MIIRLPTILMLVILFSYAIQVQAQVPLPEIVCPGTERHYWVDGLVGSTYTWKVNGVLQNSTTNKIDIIWSGKGVFNLEVQEHQAICTGAIQSALVEVTDLPEALSPVAHVTQPDCILAMGTITVTSPKPAAGIAYTLTGTNPVVRTVSNAKGVFTQLTPGNYQVSITTADGCISAPTSETINTQPATTDPIIIAESHVNIDNAHDLGSIDLTVSGGTGPATYLYSWSNGAITQDLTNLSSGTYGVAVTDNNNCNKATLTIRIESLGLGRDCDLFIPDAFSPNGDGVHDCFQIYCINHYPDAKIYIFDQLGNKIFEKTHYGNPEFWGTHESAWWCGKPDRGPGNARNEMVAPGTYYYVLDLGNGEVKKSFVFVSY